MSDTVRDVLRMVVSKMGLPVETKFMKVVCNGENWSHSENQDKVITKVGVTEAAVWHNHVRILTFRQRSFKMYDGNIYATSTLILTSIINSMRLFCHSAVVVPMHSYCLNMNVRWDMQVSQLKSMIAAKVPNIFQRHTLVFAGKVPESVRLLCDYNIQQNSKLHVVAR